jgi:uncharacterized protein
VCGTGLDTAPLPGDVSEEQLGRILGDMATLAVKWKKPLSARLQPVAGKKSGDRTDYDDPFLTTSFFRSYPESETTKERPLDRTPAHSSSGASQAR